MSSQTVTPYLSENEAENLQNGDVHLALTTIWRIEIGEGSFFCIFCALSFELNLFCEWSCPLILEAPDPFSEKPF